MKVKYLIIGNSVAGTNCVQAIREVDSKGSIYIISDEDILNYSRPLISYYLGGRIGRDRISFRDASFYEENKVDLILGKRATSIDINRKKVNLEDGRGIGFDKLLLSVGGTPIIPPMEGYEEGVEGIFTFTRLSDAEALISYIEEQGIKEATVLGGGLIGLKATEGLIERGIRVKVIELADRILANTFDKEASLIIEERLKRCGCEVLKENTIQRIIVRDGKIEEIILRDGKRIATKLLIIAVGVRPNLELVRDTKIKYEKGIIVNKYMQTNVRDIYAAGDCAQGLDFLSRTNAVIAIWPVAARQGKIAGFNMAGKKEVYQGLFIMNSVQILDIPTISFGITNPRDPGYEVLKQVDRERDVYKKIVLKENRVVGVILLNSIDRGGIYGMLIRERIDVGNFKSELLSDDFGFLVLPKEFRKHMVIGEGVEV